MQKKSLISTFIGFWWHFHTIMIVLKKTFLFSFFWSKSHYNGDLKLKNKYIKKIIKITLLWWPKNSYYLNSHSSIPKIYIIFIKITLLWMQKKIINFKICWFFGQIITTMVVQKNKKNKKIKHFFWSKSHYNGIYNFCFFFLKITLLWMPNNFINITICSFFVKYTLQWLLKKIKKKISKTHYYGDLKNINLFY